MCSPVKVTNSHPIATPTQPPVRTYYNRFIQWIDRKTTSQLAKATETQSESCLKKVALIALQFFAAIILTPVALFIAAREKLAARFSSNKPLPVTPPSTTTTSETKVIIDPTPIKEAPAPVATASEPVAPSELPKVEENTTAQAPAASPSSQWSCTIQ